jgi:hypothetical protein
MPVLTTMHARIAPLVACLAFGAGLGVSQDSLISEAKEGDAGLVLMSKSANPEVFAPLKQAESTVLAPVYVWKYGILRPFKRQEWEARGETWDTFFSAAVKRADALVDTLEPQFRRDARGVVDYALVEGASPWLSTVLLSKKLLPRFAREFGQRIHVVVTDQKRFYVFPADGGKLDRFGESLSDVFHDEALTKNPVTLEVFLVDQTGFRAIGKIGK